MTGLIIFLHNTSKDHEKTADFHQDLLRFSKGYIKNQEETTDTHQDRPSYLIITTQVMKKLPTHVRIGHILSIDRIRNQKKQATHIRSGRGLS